MLNSGVKILLICALFLVALFNMPVYPGSISRNVNEASPGKFTDIPVTTSGDSLFKEGNLADRHNQYTKAADLFTRALILAQNDNNILLEAKCLERLGSIYLTIGQDNLALTKYYEALPLFEKAGDKEGIAMVYTVIAFNKFRMDELDSAVSYYEKAEQLNIEIGNNDGLVQNKGNMAYMYQSTGEYEKARQINYELINSLIEAHDSLNLPVIYYNLSSLYIAMDSVDEAIMFLKKAIPICESTKDTSLLSSLFGYLGEIYIEDNKLDSASYFLKKSLACSNRLNVFEEEYLALLALARIDTMRANYKDAMPKIWQMLDIKDSIGEMKIRHHYEATELKYKNQKQNDLIELQRHELAEGEKVNNLLRLLVLASMISIGFLVVNILLIRKNNARKKQMLQDQLQLKECAITSAQKDELITRLQIEKLEHEISIKEREQVSSAMSLEQKNELLGIINDKIKDAMTVNGMLSVNELNGVVGRIRDQLKDSSRLDIFNQQFSRLHKDFYEKLKTAHPDLTKSELKFCAFLKLKLSSHQIASILNVSAEAIRKSRYRIRKKMKLSRDITLDDYINQF